MQTNKIKEECYNKKIPVAKMLKDLELSPNTLNKWDNGVDPKISNLLKIAEYLNVSLDYLVNKTEQPTKIEQSVSHNTLNDQSIGINNVQSIENNLTKELINEFEKLSFKNKSYVMNIIAELNEPIDQNFKMVASPSRPEPPKVSKESIKEVKRLMQEIENEKL